MDRQTLLGVLAGLVVTYAALLVGLALYARRHPETVSAREALRLLPDLLRALRRMLHDPTLPRRVRVGVALLLGYLLLPFDLVPDFVPVLGYADDVLVVALVLRWVVRAAGADALARHWPGTPQGLAVIGSLAGL